jgi:hypothetical protein
VRDLVLVLPDLSLFDSDAAPARGSGLTRLRFARSAPLRGGWRGLMARGLGRSDLVAVDPAEVVASALGAAEGGTGSATGSVTDRAVEGYDAWLVSPLHLVPGLKTVHLAPGGLLHLQPDEAVQVCAEFNGEFVAEGLRLRPVGTAGFLLRGLSAAGALTVEPQRLLGGSLEEALPGGAGGGVLRAFLTECEMWLHGSALNRRRGARGEPPVTTLWPWGGGSPLREPLAIVPSEAHWPRVWADDAWVAALGTLAGQAIAPMPPSAASLVADEAESGCAVVSVMAQGLATLDRDFLAPAAEALRTGRLQRLTVAADDRAVGVTAGDRHRFWRPERDLLSALLEGRA